MASVFPFAAYSPAFKDAADVATLPYDVMNRAEAQKMASSNAKSFLRVTRSEIELDDSIDAYSPDVYERARINWNAFVADGVLSKDAAPAYYVYSLVMNGRRQTGIVGAYSVADYEDGTVRRHERTRKDKEDDRTRHISMLRVQTGPVFLTYRDSDAINAIVDTAMKTAPLFDFTAEDGITHTGWRVPAELTASLQKAFADLPRLYIADGHHRAASAARTLATLTENGTATPETGRVLSVIFPASQLKILAYNRLVFNLGTLTPQQFIEKLQAVCTMKPTDNPIPDTIGKCCMYFQKKWVELTLNTPAADADPIDKLDVSVLQHDVLSPILGIDDPRTSRRIDFVGGIRGTAELERRVDSGEAVVAFSMYPTTLDQLMDIADNNGIMPPKSTWFEPKLRDGLFVHEI